MERLIFHVDVNSAFLSWEAAKRVLEGGQDLRLIPSAIAGERSKRTGVILAKSNPAKAFGVKTGEPVSMAKAKCPKLVLAPPDFALYESCSDAFIKICRKYSPVVEKWSIDECFIDMSGMQAIYPEPLIAANKLKNEILDTLGFSVNIGVANNKLLAKMASDFEKPNKVHTLFSYELETKLWPQNVRALFFAGRATAERLERAGIFTIGDIAKSDIIRLKALIGVKAGQQLYEYANGRDSSPVLLQAELPKGYSAATTLEEDVRTHLAAYNVLLSLSESIAARLRADGAKTACVAVNIRSSKFKNSSRQMQLKTETDITSEIFSISKKLFLELWDGETPLRLLGLSLTNLSWGVLEQATFFNEARERERAVDKTIDKIRSKYGVDAISRCSLSKSAAKKSRQIQQAKRYED